MMHLKDIIDICNGELINIVLDEDLLCTDFCIDSRKIKPGDIYIGIKGDVHNGNNFYQDAFNNGAILCILDKDTKINEATNNNIILVDNTIECLQKLAEYKRSLYDIPVIAVTGSVGKTSVKDIIYGVTRDRFNVLCTEGNLNNHLGVPLTILKLNNHDLLIVEMGMNHFGELHLLSNIAKPTIGVITNIGTAHIGNLGSRENILKAKLEILDGMNNGILIVNNDNDLLHTVTYDNLITIGIDNHSNYMAYDIKDKIFSSNFYINDEPIEIPIGSKAFIYNALFAFAVGRELGMSSKEISNSLKNFKLTPHRLELIKTKKFNIIDDTYNASLDSVKNALELLSKVNKRKVFIFADILELDEYAESIHIEIGKIIINMNIDILITVGNVSKYTYETVKGSDTKCYYFKNNNELIKNINEILCDDDMVLIKGSHGMNLIEIVNYLKNCN